MLNRLIGRTKDGDLTILGRRVHWHSQNLDNRPGDTNGKSSGSKWLHGRAWLHFGDVVIQPQWCFKSRFLDISARFDGVVDNTISVGVSVPPASLGLQVDGLPRVIFEALGIAYDPKTHNGDDCQRSIGLRVHDAGLWWDLWRREMVSSSTDPKWMHGVIKPLDFVFGGEDITKRVVGTQDVEIPMPEGVYKAKAETTGCRRHHCHSPRRSLPCPGS